MATRRKAAFLPAGAEQFLREKTIEGAGLALIAVAIAFLTALVSYHPSDPSLNTATGASAKNVLGYTGAYVSDLFLQSLGIAGALLAPIAAGWGWRLWKEHAIRQPWLRIGLLPVGLLFAAIAFAAIRAPEAWPLIAGLGGYTGTWALNAISTLLQGVSTMAGPQLIGGLAGLLATIILLFVVGFSGTEWRNGAHQIFGLAARTRGAARYFDRIKEMTAHFLTATGRRLTTPTERIEPVLEPTAHPRPVKPDLVQPKKSTPEPGKKASAQRQRTLELSRPKGDSQLPPLDLLDDTPEDQNGSTGLNEESLQQNARLLIGVLEDFGVRGEIVKVRPGPVVTLYELEPAPGTKTSRVIGLADDIARSMSAISVRIATVPGRSVIGIELPNAKRETVYLREMLASSAFEESRAKLPLVAGKDIGGLPVIIDLARMPHLLIAGTTGSGKSVALNAMILSLLYRHSPEDCKFIMIDPKMLELSIYDDIPHLIAPVVTEPKRAVVALKWTVQEMESRYRAMSKLGVRNVEGYNKRVAEARKAGEILTRKVQTGFDPETGKPIIEEQPLDLSALPLIVVVVDEMADLMMVAGKDIEGAIQRLAQMARAAGIHLIMATQRPSVDVVTGTIKANFPTRISFQVTSKVDSRTILGEQGAEQLLGQGDMLYMAGGGRVTRVHGPFVHDMEVESVVRFLKSQGEPAYIEAITDEEFSGDGGGFDEPEKTGDELYDRAVALVAREGKASTSFIQRHLQIGYNRAARIIETMEKEGVVGQRIMSESARFSSEITAAPINARRGFLAALLCVFFATAADATSKPPFNPAERADLERIETYLNELGTMQSRFVQANPDGSHSEGTMYLQRPGQLRFEYDPPDPYLIITKGKWLVYVDKELDEATYVPVERTPAYFIVKNNIRFGEKIRVASFRRGNSVFRVEVEQTDQPDAGRVMLIFTDTPLQLRKWQVIDAQGSLTDTTLINPNFDVPLRETLFDFDGIAPSDAN